MSQFCGSDMSLDLQTFHFTECLFLSFCFGCHLHVNFDWTEMSLTSQLLQSEIMMCDEIHKLKKKMQKGAKHPCIPSPAKARLVMEPETDVWSSELHGDQKHSSRQ